MREDGIVLTDLAVSADGELHGSTVWRFAPSHGGELPFHRFSQVCRILSACDWRRSIPCAPQ